MSAAVKPYQPHTITITLKATGEKFYKVSNSANDGYYTVRREFGHLTCTCPAGQHHQACKHVAVIAAKLNAERKQPQATFACTRPSRETALLETAPKIEWLGSLPLKAS